MSLRLTDADREAWAAYERAGHRAQLQYEALPISFWRAGATEVCGGCGVPTKAKSGMCRECVREERAS